MATCGEALTRGQSCALARAALDLERRRRELLSHRSPAVVSRRRRELRPLALENDANSVKFRVSVLQCTMASLVAIAAAHSRLRSRVAGLRHPLGACWGPTACGPQRATRLDPPAHGPMGLRRGLGHIQPQRSCIGCPRSGVAVEGAARSGAVITAPHHALLDHGSTSARFNFVFASLQAPLACQS